MKDLPGADEQTMRELAELFAPAREVYGKECLGLFEDEELYAQIRDRFERGSSCGEYPRLSEYLSNLSAKEKEEFFRTGGEPATPPGRALVPENPGLIVRRLQQLLQRQFEFQASIRKPSRYSSRTKRGGPIESVCPFPPSVSGHSSTSPEHK
jgi:hypothetical protein